MQHAFWLVRYMSTGTSCSTEARGTYCCQHAEGHGPLPAGSMITVTLADRKSTKYEGGYGNAGGGGGGGRSYGGGGGGGYGGGGGGGGYGGGRRGQLSLCWAPAPSRQRRLRQVCGVLVGVAGIGRTLTRWGCCRWGALRHQPLRCSCLAPMHVAAVPAAPDPVQTRSAAWHQVTAFCSP